MNYIKMLTVNDNEEMLTAEDSSISYIFFTLLSDDYILILCEI